MLMTNVLAERIISARGCTIDCCDEELAMQRIRVIVQEFRRGTWGGPDSGKPLRPPRMLFPQEPAMSEA
jgi:hypothetical protein